MSPEDEKRINKILKTWKRLFKWLAEERLAKERRELANK